MTSQIASQTGTTNFNVNDYVWVQLTDVGRAELKRQSEVLNLELPRDYISKYPMPDEDTNGWSKWQLWDLMKKLGHKCANGAPLAFGTNIRFEIKSEVTNV